MVLCLTYAYVTKVLYSSVTMSQIYLVPVSNIPCPISALCYSQNLFICYPVFLIPCPLIHLTLSPYPPYPVPTLSQKK